MEKVIEIKNSNVAIVVDYEYVIDEYNNIAIRREHEDIEDTIARLGTNRFCMYCVECEYCHDCKYCEGCVHCRNCYACERVYESQDCYKCYDCAYMTDCCHCRLSSDCDNCYDSAHIHRAKNCDGKVGEFLKDE